MGVDYTFTGGTHGPWAMRRMAAVSGEPLAMATHLQVQAGMTERA